MIKERHLSLRHAGMTTLFILALQFSWALDAPTVQMRVEAEPRDITIGDHIRFTIAVVTSTDVTLTPLDIKTPLGEFEILNHTPSNPRHTGNKIEVIHAFVLTTFSTGTLQIPSLPLRFATPQGQMAEAKTDPVQINVASLLEKHGDEGNIRSLKGLFNFKSYFWLWLTLFMLASAVGIFFLLRWMKMRKQLKAGLIPQAPPRPPEEVAWEALHELEISTLLAENNVKEFYSRLSNILRTYLEGRYQIAASERTTSELMAEFRRLNLTTDVTMTLREFFENGDLVKFAKYTPIEQEVEADLDRVKKLLVLTTPQQKQENPEEVAIP